MVPHLPQGKGTGSSFKGAGMYYLHDKGSEVTSERVGATMTLNLATNNPHAAWRVMAATAMNQNQIKREAGTKATGRKLTQPVFAYSLSWSPDETPEATHMLEEAKKSLEVLGLSEHQALVVQHTDTQHPHVHILVNRVHPDTGIAAKLSHSRQKLDRYAMNYEQQHGIKCQNRIKNEQKRELAQQHREKRIKALRETRGREIEDATRKIYRAYKQAEWDASKRHCDEDMQLARRHNSLKEKLKSWFDFRGVLPDQHAMERAELTATQREEMATIYRTYNNKEKQEKQRITELYAKRIARLVKVGDQQRNDRKREEKRLQLDKELKQQRERRQQQRSMGYDMGR